MFTSLEQSTKQRCNEKQTAASDHTMLFCSARAPMASRHNPVNKLDLQMQWWCANS